MNFLRCGGQKDDDDGEHFRTLACNDGPANKTAHKFVGNEIHTTKYTLLTFIPKALFEQYRRVANLYFTLVAGLSLTSFSPVNPYTTFGPLALVIGISLAKEAHEDYKRYQVDSEINARKVLVYRDGEFRPVAWKDCLVGDVMQVKGDEYFPADLILLSSSTPEGVCYIETMNLDGETNLKIKKGMEETWQFTERTIGKFQGHIECEQPNNSLYTFTGNLVLPDPATGRETKLSLSPAQVLLRGSSLRNTDWVLGVVVFTGHDTKVMKNATEAPSKRSTLERQLDLVVLFMFATLCVMCIIGAVNVAVLTKDRGANMWYMDLASPDVPDQFNPRNPSLVGLENFVTLFILYAYLIPISLYVSIEMVKVTQSMVFINFDRKMYHRETDTPALARTSNLNEELGMVETVLSDKTGTLTRNMMEFFKCSIAGVQYGTGSTEIERSVAERQGRKLGPESEELPAIEKSFNFRDKRLEGVRWMSEARPDVIKHFFRLLAICHTAIPEGEPTEDKIKYQAESPDEAAFVVAAKRFGHFFYRRTPTSVYVAEVGPDGKKSTVQYEILNILEFNSTRKRMSVVFRQLPDGPITLYCKGADSVIYERLADTGNEFKEATLQHMEEYGEGGLRTLCLAYAELDPAFYDAWQAKYMAARTSLEDRDRKLEEVSEEIERNLILLGSTAIEDKLQSGVGKTIEKLASAGIKIWVLTGDKQETAINIGFACSLLTNEQAMYVIDTNLGDQGGQPVRPPSANIKSANNKAADPLVAYVAEQLREATREIAGSEFADDPDAFSLVIDGKALTYALREDLKQAFLDLASRCKAVICCRVSPLQKALVTLLVKSRGRTTLAIGDGANDVGMIQAADIGVGISGQEGMQAVMAADFAIAQFRFLERLLLVHGRYNYKRIAKMVNYFFYKNTLFGFTLFWFNIFCFFTGQVFFNQWFMSGYNVFFTSLPVLVMGMMDQDVSPDIGRRFAPLYRQGLRNSYFDLKSKAMWIGNGLLQSVILFFGVCLAYDWDRIADRQSGTVAGMWKMGTTLYTCINVTTLIQFVLSLNYVTWIHGVVIVGTLCLWYIGALMVWASFPLYVADNTWHLFLDEAATTPTYWLITLLLSVMAVLPDIVIRSLFRYFKPEDHHIVQEVEQLPMLRERLDLEGGQGAGAEPALPMGAAGRIDEDVLSGRRTAGSVQHAGADAVHTARLSLADRPISSRSLKAHTGFAHTGHDDSDRIISPAVRGLRAEEDRNPRRHRRSDSSEEAAVLEMQAMGEPPEDGPGGRRGGAGGAGPSGTRGSRSPAARGTVSLAEAADGRASKKTPKKEGGAAHTSGRQVLETQKRGLDSLSRTASGEGISPSPRLQPSGGSGGSPGMMVLLGRAGDPVSTPEYEPAGRGGRT